MTKEEFEDAYRGLIAETPTLAGNSRTTRQVTYHFEHKYLIAALRAKDQQGWDRAWFSFRQYLITPMTLRKPFVFKDEEADALVGSLQRLLYQAAEPR